MWIPEPASGSLPAATTKGDIAVYDGTDWVVVAAGADDTVLTADAAESAGVKWAAGGGGGGGTPTFSGAQVRLTSDQSIPDETDTAISWDAEVFDTDDYWAAGSPTRLVAPVAGFYYVAFGITFNQVTDSFRGWIELNGAGQRYGQSDSTGRSTTFAYGTGSFVVALDADEYAEIVVHQFSNGAEDLIGSSGSSNTYAVIALIGT